MIDFMTALPVILVQPTYPGDRRAKGFHFQSTCNLCRESHKTQVWLCFLVLSVLGVSAHAAHVPHAAHLQNSLKSLKDAIEKSDAVLYAPSTNEVEGNCKNMVLKCYILELMMVINEEEIMDKAGHIFDFNATLPAADPAEVGCPPCESYSLENSTVFLERLNSLLQELSNPET